MFSRSGTVISLVHIYNNSFVPVLKNFKPRE